MKPEKDKSEILFYYQDFGAMGGIERFILSIASAMQDNGNFKPVVICSYQTPFYNQLVMAGIEVYGIKTLGCFAKPILRMFDFISLVKLWQLLGHIKPDIVHVHIGQLENLLFKILGYPVVYTFHGYASLYSIKAVKSPLKRCLKKLLRPLFGIMATHVDRLLFVSRAEQTRMIQEGYLPKNCTGEVLYNGLPVIEICNSAKRTQKTGILGSMSFSSAYKYVSFINRLDENKNPFEFIKLAEHLSLIDGFENLHYIVAGSGPLEKALLKRIKSSPISERIHYLGYVKDTSSLIALSELVVNLSFMEGFGFGVLEAMAIGTPCLCYATGGISELLDIPRLDRLLVPVGDFDRLSGQAEMLLKLSCDERMLLGEELKKRALKFDFANFVMGMEEVYSSIVSDGKDFNPLVSVIMPVYQGEKLIVGAVKSVLNQTYANFELIVVDDGSTDETVEKLESFVDHRLHILHQENSGVASARNLGISKAKGEYIAFLDVDDRWFAQKIEKEIEVVRRSQDPVCIVYSGYYAVDDTDLLVNMPAVYTEKGNLFRDVLENEGIMLPSTTIMHRKILETLGGFSSSSYHEDRVFFIQACQKFPAYPTGERLVVYRQTLDGRCRSILKNRESAYQAELSIVDTLKPILDKDDIEKLTIIQHRNLLCRFLMYNFLSSAKALRQYVPPMEFIKNKKGLLALASITLEINFLYGCRLIAQFITRYGLLPWWKLKSLSVYQN